MSPAPDDAEIVLLPLITIPKFAPIPPFMYRGRDLGTLRLREPERIDGSIAAPHRMRVLVDLAKHQSGIRLPCFQAWFEIGQRPAGYNIDYRIHVASTPKIKTGTLHVKVDVKDPTARYSEDIDLVQVAPEAIGPTLDELREALDPWLGEPVRTVKERARSR